MNEVFRCSQFHKCITKCCWLCPCGYWHWIERKYYERRISKIVDERRWQIGTERTRLIFARSCVERGCARRHRHPEVWPWSGSHTARRALAWRPRSGVIQAGSDSSPVSELRPPSTVPVRLLCPGRRCWHSATAAFQQRSTSCSTMLPAQYLWLPGLFSCWAMPAP